MIITKTMLPRRTFLRGVGTTLALPLLDAMVPALSAMRKTAAKPTPRLGFFFVPNGVYPPHWRPTGDETKFELSRILQPMAPFKDQVVVVTGLSNAQADAVDVGGANHTRCHAAWLSGSRPRRTEGADIELGTTIDQIAAPQIGKDTQLLSLELALEPNYIVANCEGGYSCAYVNSTSWRSPTTPLPMENNPRAVFERLFGEGYSGRARREQLRLNRSILDSVTADVAQLRQVLGPSDRATVTQYLDAIREVEARIQRSERLSESSDTAIGAPVGIPASFEEHAKLMFDLQFLAYRADITRVVTFQIGREQSARSYPQIGVDVSHHDASHWGRSPEMTDVNSKINAYHVELLAHLVEKMRATPDGDGSLMDHAIFLYGSGMGDGNEHIPHDLPVLLVGGGCGQLKGDRFLNCPMDTPMMNLGVSLVQKMGGVVDKIGDSTGPLVGL